MNQSRREPNCRPPIRRRWAALLVALLLPLLSPPLAAAAAALPPPHAQHDRVKRALAALSNALQSAKCVECHGARGATQGDALWRLELLGKAGVVGTGARRISARAFLLYKVLSGEGAVQMPPTDPATVVPTNRQLLDRIAARPLPPTIEDELRRMGANPESYRQALGTQLVYVNAKGVCFDREVTRASPGSGRLCDALAELADVASTWKGSLADSLRAWRTLTDLAKTSDLFRTRVPPTGHLAAAPVAATAKTFQSVPPVSVATVAPKAVFTAARPTLAAKETLVYRLPDGQTVSYYTRVAPDQSWIAVRAESFKGPAADTRPFLLSPSSLAARTLNGSAYDAAFTPDYDERAGHGLILAQRGAAANPNFAKVENFYLPGGANEPRRAWLFPDASGYPSIAKISDPDAVNAAWGRFSGQYVVMGKRWRWFVVRDISDASGRTMDVAQVYPGNQQTAPPICPSLWRPESGLYLLNADAMVSPDGRWISTKRSTDQALVVVSTKSCTVERVVERRGVPVPGGKATFSSDGNYLAFHAYGNDGTTYLGSPYANNNLIARLADSGVVSNIFIYDLARGRLRQVTRYDQATPYVALYPMFDGTGDTLYFHRHERGGRASEIVKITNMRQYLEAAARELASD